jgi:hypothetical protein
MDARRNPFSSVACVRLRSMLFARPLPKKGGERRPTLWLANWLRGRSCWLWSSPMSQALRWQAPYVGKVMSDSELAEVRAYLSAIPEPPPLKTLRC